MARAKSNGSKDSTANLGFEAKLSSPMQTTPSPPIIDPEPMVYIASRRMTPRKQATTEIKAYSNCAEVELKVNGKPIGTAKPDDIKVARWPDVTLQPGKNKIEVQGRAGDKSLSDACEWELQSNP